MLCLHDTIHDDDPAVQRFLSAVEDAHSLTVLILAAWQVARVLTIHLVEAVLAERSQHPTHWPRCPQCGAGLRSKGFAKRQITSLFGPSSGGDGSDGVPMGVRRPRWPPWMRPWAYSRISGAVGSSRRWAVPWRFLCRLRLQPACWAGTVGALSVHRRCGDGCKRRVNKRWRHSRSTCMRSRKATCQRRRRWRPSWPRLPWS